MSVTWIAASIDTIFVPREARRPTRTTIALDDALVVKAQAFTGLTDQSSLVREALEAMIERESASRLARLGAQLSREAVIASAAKRSRASRAGPGLPRRYAPRNDGKDKAAFARYVPWKAPSPNPESGRLFGTCCDMRNSRGSLEIVPRQQVGGGDMLEPDEDVGSRSQRSTIIRVRVPFVWIKAPARPAPIVGN